MKTVNALALRKRLGAVLDEVVRRKKPVVVSRANQPLAVLVPYEAYQEKFDGEARRARIRRACESMDRLSESLKGKLTGPDSTEIIRAFRDGNFEGS